ncbi:LppU/SCO3897 family protein [Actinomadura macra]|uniref:LppU/SCO3897 family protein n=1 Tax=Actinomadura macra TaxID=46164 RepID=UPI000ACD19D5|nr:hypothetical protein [Actinomadura macra]
MSGQGSEEPNRHGRSPGARGGLRPPRRRRRIILAAGAGIAAAVALGAVVLSHGVSGAPSGPVTAEQCVATRMEMGSAHKIPFGERVTCDDAKAAAKVVKVTAEGERSAFDFATRSAPDCPDGSDGVVRVTAGSNDRHYWESCVRNLAGPHPGDPGAGGAMISVGDCVNAAFGFGGEKPCSEPDWYGKVIARVQAESACPASRTLETMTLSPSDGRTAPPRPVLCLGHAGKIIGSGDCITDPTLVLGEVSRADCTSDDAVAKVVTRVKSTGECPSGATNYLSTQNRYLPVICLKKLRPTLGERLRPLPG